MIGILTLALAGTTPPASAADRVPRVARFSDSATADLLAGQGQHPGDWALEASLGFPWQRLRGIAGVGRRLTVGAELETVFGRRFRPSASIAFALSEHRHARVSGELGLGWLVQMTPEKPDRGFSYEGRLRAAFPIGRAIPYFNLALRPTARFDRVQVERLDETIDTWLENRAMLTIWSSVGVAVAINQHVGIDVGFDIVRVDIPAVSIPGMHLGVLLGGWGAR